jgi:hypothetical protein
VREGAQQQFVGGKTYVDQTYAPNAVADPPQENLGQQIDRATGLKPMGHAAPPKAAEPKPTIPRLVTTASVDSVRSIISGLA